MPNPCPTSATPFSEEDRQIWENLKRAIASSSGFQRWQIEQQLKDSPAVSGSDSLIRLYLRETLETLAY
ncbi:hypothetical protein [Oscillatoria sp. FACHB-1406]|uniref:hypothetical protein n=1 Tax=Oscillatoria sp. FACHB-1406 TaxID=2692846 RepID=UPI001689B43D|nr:hypothetical protein [Oscillatoria sp. FACHB-1406]MBD2576407.1 hypothetical protein [Oscillatoria sp. FACHB-1406]